MSYLLLILIFSMQFCSASPVELKRALDPNERIKNLIDLNVVQFESRPSEGHNSHHIEAEIKGKLLNKNWSVLWGTTLNSIKVNALGDFTFWVPIENTNTEIDIAAISPKGNTFKEKLILFFPEYDLAQQYKYEWKFFPVRFEMSLSFFYASQESYVLGGTFSYAPNLQTTFDWLNIVPRLSCRLSKDTSGKILPLGTLGVDFRIRPKNWRLFLATGSSYGLAFESGTFGNYPEVTGILGYNLAFKDSSLLHVFDTLFLRYDRLFSPVPLHVMSFGFSFIIIP